MAKIGVGIIGLKPKPADASGPATALGYWAAMAHLPALKNSDKYEIVAVSNSTIESSQRAIEVYGLPETAKAYASPEDLANDPRVEFVVISVNVQKHFELAKPVLEKKKNIFVEWPLGASLAESEELARLAEVAGVRTSVGVQGRADPLVGKIKEILASGKIGKVLTTVVSMNTGYLPMDVWIEGAEYYLDHKSGGNQFFIGFGHFLDSFVHVLGDFEDLQSVFKLAYTSLPIANTKGEIVNPAYKKTSADIIAVQGTLENGAVASLSMRRSRTSVDNIATRWIISGTEGEIEVVVRGTQWQLGGDRSLKIRVGTEDAQDVDFTDEFEATHPTPSGNPARQYYAFAVGNDEKVASFQSALKTAKLLDRIVKAAGWESV